MATLLQMDAIIHGADKGLGPYVASRPKAIQQVISKHLLGDTYEQLSEETEKKEQRESEHKFRLLVKKHEKKLTISHGSNACFYFTQKKEVEHPYSILSGRYTRIIRPFAQLFRRVAPSRKSSAFTPTKN